VAENLHHLVLRDALTMSTVESHCHEKAIALKHDRFIDVISNSSILPTPAIDYKTAITHLKAVGFKPGDKVWMRLWLPKDTPIELAKHFELAYQDKQNNWRLSVINGFLLFGENEQETTFTQIFGSKGQKEYQNGWQQLEKWNRAGFGVGFIPNRGGKKDSEITECWCLFYEMDDCSLEEQMNTLHLLEDELSSPATIVLRTRKSLHCWFRLSKILEPEIWSEYQRRLAHYLQSDSSLHDLSQVMRLAGFLHQSISPEKAATWEKLQESTLSEREVEITKKAFLSDWLDSIAVSVIQHTGKVFDLSTFDSLLPSIRELENMRYKEFQKSFSFPYPEPIPLEIGLSKKNRDALNQGQKEGNRNKAGFAFACDLLGLANHLNPAILSMRIILTKIFILNSYQWLEYPFCRS